MLNIPPNHVQLYDDGAEHPVTPERKAGEAAYREAFLGAAREAGQWKRIDRQAMDVAWAERRQVRENAEVFIPSSELFDMPGLNSEQIIYREGHIVEASRTRGRVHGFEFVSQAWTELLKAGFDPKRIGPEIIKPWVKDVAEWALDEITPESFIGPPAPEDRLTANQQRMLDDITYAIANSDPDDLRMVLKKSSGVTREVLEWLWPGRIPLGKLTLLAGDPGLGKSFVTLDIAARVSNNAAWPDTPLIKQTPGDVILFNAEDDLADTIAPRLDKIGANDERIFAFSGIQHRDPKTKKEMLRSFSLEQDLPDLDAALQENPDTRLVVIDPVAAYLGKVDSYKNADVRGLLAPLADLAGKHRVAVVTVTHLSKSGGSKAVYRAMGSLAFAAASRAVWAIVKDQDDPNRRLFLPAKLNLARDPDGLAYSIKGGRVVWDTNAVSLHADDAFAQESRDQQRGKPKSTERNEAADYLRQELADGPKPASDVIELGEQYGFTKRTLQRAFTSINGERKKESFEGPWIWQLKPEGDIFHQRDT